MYCVMYCVLCVGGQRGNDDIVLDCNVHENQQQQQRRRRHLLADSSADPNMSSFTTLHITWYMLLLSQFAAA